MCFATAVETLQHCFGLVTQKRYGEIMKCRLLETGRRRIFLPARARARARARAKPNICKQARHPNGPFPPDLLGIERRYRPTRRCWQLYPEKQSLVGQQILKNRYIPYIWISLICRFIFDQVHDGGGGGDDDDGGGGGGDVGVTDGVDMMVWV